MPFHEQSRHASASDFLRYVFDVTPGCPHLTSGTFASICDRSSKPPSDLADHSVLPYIAKVRGAYHDNAHRFPGRLHQALINCAATAATRYRFAYRPARSDLVAMLAEGLLSAARSGAISHADLAEALADVFPDSLSELNVLIALEVLAGAIRDSGYFVDPLVGHHLALAHVKVLSRVRRFSDSVAQDIMGPSLLPLLAVPASTLTSPGTGEVAKEFAPCIPTLETTGQAGLVRLVTTYAPSLTTNISISSGQKISIRMDRDVINAFGAVMLLPTTEEVRELPICSFNTVPVARKHRIRIGVGNEVLEIDSTAVRDLQVALDLHLNHPTHRAWSNHRAIMMGDF